MARETNFYLDTFVNFTSCRKPLWTNVQTTKEIINESKWIRIKKSSWPGRVARNEKMLQNMAPRRVPEIFSSSWHPTYSLLGDRTRSWTRIDHRSFTTTASQPGHRIAIKNRPWKARSVISLLAIVPFQTRVLRFTITFRVN